MKQNLLSAIPLIFFLQWKLEILCYYTHLFQLLSGLVPRRGNTLSEKSSHQKPLDAVQIRGVFGAEHMQMLADTRILSLPDWQEHSWSLQEEMAITERTVYFAGRGFAQSQQTIPLESLFSCTELHVLTVPLGDSLLSTEQKALTTRKKKRKKINPFAYFDFVFVNFWTDGNIPQWKFYKNFHLLSECRPEIFPWWKSGVWVIKQALCYLPGIFTQKTQKALPLQ